MAEEVKNTALDKLVSDAMKKVADDLRSGALTAEGAGNKLEQQKLVGNVESLMRSELGKLSPESVEQVKPEFVGKMAESLTKIMSNPKHVTAGAARTVAAEHARKGVEELNLQNAQKEAPSQAQPNAEGLSGGGARVEEEVIEKLSGMKRAGVAAGTVALGYAAAKTIGGSMAKTDEKTGEKKEGSLFGKVFGVALGGLAVVGTLAFMRKESPVKVGKEALAAGKEMMGKATSWVSREKARVASAATEQSR